MINHLLVLPGVGRGDIYPKDANLVHTVKQVTNNDTVFKSILQGMSRDFHQIWLSSPARICQPYLLNTCATLGFRNLSTARTKKQ